MIEKEVGKKTLIDFSIFSEPFDLYNNRLVKYPKLLFLNFISSNLGRCSPAIPPRTFNNSKESRLSGSLNCLLKDLELFLYFFTQKTLLFVLTAAMWILYPMIVQIHDGNARNAGQRFVGLLTWVFIFLLSFGG